MFRSTNLYPHLPNRPHQRVDGRHPQSPPSTTSRRQKSSTRSHRTRSSRTLKNIGLRASRSAAHCGRGRLRHRNVVRPKVKRTTSLSLSHLDVEDCRLMSTRTSKEVRKTKTRRNMKSMSYLKVGPLTPVRTTTTTTMSSRSTHQYHAPPRALPDLTLLLADSPQPSTTRPSPSPSLLSPVDSPKPFNSPPNHVQPTPPSQPSTQT